MKIAVQISGAIRTLSESYRSLKQQILDHYDCDIYFSTFGQPNQEVMDLLHPVGYEFIPFSDAKLSELGISDLAEKYGHTTTKDFKQAYLFVRQKNVLLGMYHKMNVNRLRLKSMKPYDVVISTRTDLIYGERLVAKYMLGAQQYVLIPMGFDWDSGLNDLFQIGPPDHMTTVCDEFDYYQEYMDMGFTTHPENLFRHHFNHQHIPYTRFSYTMYLKDERTS